MSNVNNKNISLEILISTKDRDNLDFLNSIFINNDTHTNSILIINQTQNINFSCPHSDNINLVNVSETGLSKSRNLAIEKAKSDICLFADDDIVYENDYDSIILNAFNLNPSADIITFKMNDLKGNSFKDYPIIKDDYKKIFSPETSYQMTSILEGVVQRGTAKKLKDLKLNIAGKTGTTNKNTDTWFVGYTSNLLIGVYVGLDDPSPLGRFETGSKTALPIFKEFVEKTVNKSEARPFKAAKGTVMMVVDPNTGQKAKFNSKNTIIEVYKKQNVIDGKVLYSNNDRLDTNNILKFY